VPIGFELIQRKGVDFDVYFINAKTGAYESGMGISSVIIRVARGLKRHPLNWEWQDQLQSIGMCGGRRPMEKLFTIVMR
jgi:hypothetical protein